MELGAFSISLAVKDLQASKEFYEKLGYSIYGVLEDRPIGTLLYHMKKRLSEDRGWQRGAES